MMVCNVRINGQSFTDLLGHIRDGRITAVYDPNVQAPVRTSARRAVAVYNHERNEFKINFNRITSDEQRGLIYRMQLAMASKSIRVEGREIPLKPGMAVTAEVKTGHRRVIEFFLSPLLRAKSESVRER